MNQKDAQTLADAVEEFVKAVIQEQTADDDSDGQNGIHTYHRKQHLIETFQKVVKPVTAVKR